MTDTIKEFLVSITIEQDERSRTEFLGTMAEVAKRVTEFALTIKGVEAALSASIVGFAEKMDRLFWMAERSGTTVQNLRALEYASKQTGGEFATMFAAVQRFHDIMEKMGPMGQRLIESYMPNEDFRRRLREAKDDLERIIILREAIHGRQRDRTFEIAEMEGLGIPLDALRQLEKPEFLERFREAQERARKMELGGGENERSMMEEIRRLQRTVSDIMDSLTETASPKITARLRELNRFLSQHNKAIVRFLNDLLDHGFNSLLNAIKDYSKTVRQWMRQAGMIPDFRKRRQPKTEAGSFGRIWKHTLANPIRDTVREIAFLMRAFNRLFAMFGLTTYEPEPDTQFGGAGTTGPAAGEGGATPGAGGGGSTPAPGTAPTPIAPGEPTPAPEGRTTPAPGQQPSYAERFKRWWKGEPKTPEGRPVPPQAQPTPSDRAVPLPPRRPRGGQEGAPQVGAGAVPPGTGGDATTGQAGYNRVYAIAAAMGDPYPAVTAAQWANESAWGRRPSGKFNFFGQKARAGEPGTSRMTWEVIGGRKVRMPQRFKDYASMEAGIRDHVRKWASKYAGARSAEEAVGILKRHGYATDPAYVSKIIGIMRRGNAGLGKVSNAVSESARKAVSAAEHAVDSAKKIDLPAIAGAAKSKVLDVIEAQKARKKIPVGSEGAFRGMFRHESTEKRLHIDVTGAMDPESVANHVGRVVKSESGLDRYKQTAEGLKKLGAPLGKAEWEAQPGDPQSGGENFGRQEDKDTTSDQLNFLRQRRERSLKEGENV